MQIELIGGPMDGLLTETTNDVLFIKCGEDRISIYYRDKKANKFQYYTITSESDLIEVSEIMLSDCG